MKTFLASLFIGSGCYIAIYGMRPGYLYAGVMLVGLGVVVALVEKQEDRW